MVNNHADIVSTSVAKDKFACPCIHCQLTMQARDFRTLQSNIFAKTKKFAKPFLFVHRGPRSSLLSKKMVRKSRNTVPLNLNECIV